jgi:NTP pyrophosphatase (non-canonical NTP hydrolase)
MSTLTFDQLRKANTARLPQFKNKKGEWAHRPDIHDPVVRAQVVDGSDWSPAQWLQALCGELGEYANVRKKFERGDIDAAEFEREAADELADVATYLDLLASQLKIDLGFAVTSKFNRVSQRVGSSVMISGLGVITDSPIYHEVTE